MPPWCPSHDGAPGDEPRAYLSTFSANVALSIEDVVETQSLRQGSASVSQRGAGGAVRLA